MPMVPVIPIVHHNHDDDNKKRKDEENHAKSEAERKLKLIEDENKRHQYALDEINGIHHEPFSNEKDWFNLAFCRYGLDANTNIAKEWFNNAVNHIYETVLQDCRSFGQSMAIKYDEIRKQNFRYPTPPLEQTLFFKSDTNQLKPKVQYEKSKIEEFNNEITNGINKIVDENMSKLNDYLCFDMDMPSSVLAIIKHEILHDAKKEFDEESIKFTNPFFKCGTSW